VPPRPRKSSSTYPALAEKVRDILNHKNLTLYQVSQQSAELYGRSSPFFVPHNLYYDFRTGLFRPSIHQVWMLSHVSGYRMADWLRVFGYNLEDIARLQVLLPSKRTLVLDTSLIDSNEWIPWIEDRRDEASIPSITPLAKLLRAAPVRQIASLTDFMDQTFLYAKVGTEDTFAFPELLPGSIVRVNPDLRHEDLRENALSSDRVFLVEHSKGFCCCRIRLLENGTLVPLDNGLRHAQVKLHFPQEVKLWGTVDFEFRPLWYTKEPKVPKDLARRWKPQPLTVNEDFGQLLKSTRRRRNLSVREAARMSHTIAEILKDGRYAISPSSLSDYELRNVVPRNFHKIITLCSIYGLHVESVLRRTGIDLSDQGADPMPDRYLSHGEPPVASKVSADDVRTGFLGKLLEECHDIPIFLRHSLGYFSGSPHVSLDDFFWVGGGDDPLHPYLANGLMAMVNRRRKTPLYFVSKPLWQQPIYVILKRDGSHIAACCGVENGVLIVHPYSEDFRQDEEYALRQDAEVVGQIVAIARRLP
jgi:transcriptional regulator with XRE-family HTH domain